MHIPPQIWVEWVATKLTEYLQNQFYSPVSQRNGTFFIPQRLFKLVKSLFLKLGYPYFKGLLIIY